MKKEKIDFKDKLYGERITLKIIKPTFENAKLLFNLVNKNRDMEKWFPWVEKTKTPEDLIKYLFKVEDSLNEEEKYIYYGIFNNNILIGNISIFSLDLVKKKSGELGYWMGEDFRNKGYMSEAVKILEKEFFENYDLNRILIRCNEKNIASKKVAEKNNYFFEGASREERLNHYTQKFEDTLNFSKLKKEYYES